MQERNDNLDFNKVIKLLVSHISNHQNELIALKTELEQQKKESIRVKQQVERQAQEISFLKQQLESQRQEIAGLQLESQNKSQVPKPLISSIPTTTVATAELFTSIMPTSNLRHESSTSLHINNPPYSRMFSKKPGNPKIEQLISIAKYSGKIRTIALIFFNELHCNKFIEAYCHKLSGIQFKKVFNPLITFSIIELSMEGNIYEFLSQNFNLDDIPLIEVENSQEISLYLKDMTQKINSLYSAFQLRS